jgi:DNA mismatch repair protein MutL
MPIQRLDDETIGKIAAGEVVERPVSVVKELLENALDARARNIDISIEGGGTTGIQVSDDGVGIDPGDLVHALERHGTSKLRRFEDLLTLATLGFRGEALSSIAAVSQFQIRTRTPGSPAGAEVTVDYGIASRVRPVAAPNGTTVIVRDLFGNVPARRKFLRQASTEATYITRAVGAYAAAYPDVRVSLQNDGRTSFTTDGSGDLMAAAVAIYGSDYGRDLLVLTPLEDGLAVPGVSISGWIGAPSLNKSHRQGIHFIVNGRWVNNRALSFALEEAYHSLLMVGRHPVALVRIELDPAAVDVNVHPTKAEVWFHDERAVCRAVQRTAHAALTGARRNDLPLVHWAPAHREEDRTPERPAALLPPGRIGPDGGGDVVGSHGSAPPASGVPMLRVLGQVGASFIIAEGPEGMYLIDQHAAHERVLFERIMGQLANRAVDRQPLLDPLIVELAPDELAMWEQSASELASIGYEIEAFGEGAVVLRAVPAVALGGDLAGRFRAILRELIDGGTGASWLESVAISTACHTSIRAGQSLSLEEMRELIADLERSNQPRACGHGRPTMVHLTRDELARQFSRR